MTSFHFAVMFGFYVGVIDEFGVFFFLFFSAQYVKVIYSTVLLLGVWKPPA
jgi:hypothetical protein